MERPRYSPEQYKDRLLKLLTNGTGKLPQFKRKGTPHFSGAPVTFSDENRSKKKVEASRKPKPKVRFETSPFRLNESSLTPSEFSASGSEVNQGVSPSNSSALVAKKKRKRCKSKEISNSSLEDSLEVKVAQKNRRSKKLKSKKALLVSRQGNVINTQSYSLESDPELRSSLPKINKQNKLKKKLPSALVVKARKVSDVNSSKSELGNSNALNLSDDSNSGLSDLELKSYIMESKRKRPRLRKKDVQLNSDITVEVRNSNKELANSLLQDSDSECSEFELNISKSDCDSFVINNSFDQSDDSNCQRMTTGSAEETEVSNAEESSTFEEPQSSQSNHPEEANATNIEYYNYEDGLVITLEKGTKLYFHGLISIRVLRGKVEVYGYAMSPGMWYDLFSPRGCSFLYIEAKEFDAADSDSVKDLVLTPTTSVILCKNLHKPQMKFLEKHVSQQIFPFGKRLHRCVFQECIGLWNVLQISPEWESLAEKVNQSSRLLLCGGKSVGKSTLLRYLINRILKKFSQVLIVDLDPGQPEFTLPGCISVTVVKAPVFGPNYTHLKKPDRCIFIPHINIAYDPSGYVQHVQELMQTAKDLPTMPTLINYMGFTRGFGLEIFCTVVSSAQPNLLVEIQSSNQLKNFQQSLTPQLVAQKAQVLAKNGVAVDFSIVRIPSMTDSNQGWHLEPRQIREMCILTYMGEVLNMGVTSLTHHSVNVYMISLSKIRLIHNNKEAHPAVINANLVALCSANNHENSYICHGWGVVRGIDVPSNLYLITPLPLKDLNNVDHLILGPMTLPPSVYMTSDGNVGHVPYVCAEVLGDLGQIPKRSYMAPLKDV